MSDEPPDDASQRRLEMMAVSFIALLGLGAWAYVGGILNNPLFAVLETVLLVFALSTTYTWWNTQ